MFMRSLSFAPVCYFFRSCMQKVSCCKTSAALLLSLFISVGYVCRSKTGRRLCSSLACAGDTIALCGMFLTLSNIYFSQPDAPTRRPNPNTPTQRPARKNLTRPFLIRSFQDDPTPFLHATYGMDTCALWPDDFFASGR